MLGGDDVEVLRAYWRFFEPRSARINANIRRIAAASPVWGRLLASVPVGESPRASQLQRAAILEGQWEPYIASLHDQGTQSTQHGVSYYA